MQSLSDALNRFHDDAAWFARAHEVRLLVVRASPEVRKVIVTLLAGYELHPDDASAWTILEDARTGEDDGWQARANRLAAEWQRHREAFARDGVELPVVEAAAEAGTAPAAWRSPALVPPALRVAPFLLTAARVVAALRDPLRGLVIVLAPGIVDDAAALEDEVQAVLVSPPFVAARVVLVLDEDVPPPRRLLATLGERGLCCDALVDPAQQERDVEALIGAGASGPASAGGTAGPRGVTPPRRVDDPPDLPKEQRDEALRAAGIDPRYLDEAPRLRNLVFGAALAMKRGRTREAAELQQQAVELCARLELHLVKVICQMALASYLSGAGEADRALRELESAARDAEAHGLKFQQCQALLSIGLLHGVARRLPQAAKAYVRAARAAEAASVPALAIEAWRLAGQLAGRQGLTGQAAAAFLEAMRIAGAMAPKEAQATSASEAARALAATYRGTGLTAQADSLDAQADELERGDRPAPAPGSPPERAVGARA